ncbi:MAG: 2OG-Fe(II) oxygenase [Sulfuritalea sp.]|nr:2OG-Fe(II) oxygenase [Sulfuritalea sp.]
MFLTEAERRLTEEYLQQGYVIRPVADREALDWMRAQFVRLIGDALGAAADARPEDLLNQIHKSVPVAELNSFRLKIIRDFNGIEEFREMYFRVARPYLEALVSNELAMQLRVNLSIQFPGDDSSLLPVHADTWSGDSPFEVVVWLPLVDCYRTKAMYLLPPDESRALDRQFTERTGGSSEALYQAIKDDVRWLEVRYGEVLVFDQALPHGNRINEEPETRWTMNCRFKGVFTPYGDKKIGEFFEPVTLRAASRTGMAYQLPKTS